MPLYEKIQADIKTAMKAKDMQTLDALRVLFSSLKNKAIDLKRELEDAEVAGIIKSDLKKIEDAMEMFLQGERQDLVEKAQKEIGILKAYLPAELTDEDLEMTVKKVLSGLGDLQNAHLGKTIGSVMTELKGLVDGKRVKEMVERLLSSK